VDVDVLIVGAGPAGLTAAAELRRLGVPRVLVADREAAPGGIPRHSLHTGYGLRDLHRVLSGPAYARALADAALRSGAELRTGCTVTELRAGEDALCAVLTSASGIEEVRPAAVLLATGCRERPRAARLVPGDRPAGVLTTGELQQRVYLGGERLEGRALVVGAEHVSFSAVVTLAHAGARVVALVTEHERQQSYAAFRLGAALRWGVPVWTSTVVTRVTGAAGRLASVELGSAGVAGADGGQARTVPCDWLVFTGDWIPDHVLARSAGLALDPGTRGPAVDTSLATSAPGVFAAGNLIHAAETADVAALSGRHAARQIGSFLAGGAAAGRATPAAARIPVVAEAPLRWVSPNAIALGEVMPPLGRFVLRSAECRRSARLEARQDGRLLATSRPRRLIPGRPVYLRASWVASVDPGGGPVRVGVERARLRGLEPRPSALSRLGALAGFRIGWLRRPDEGWLPLRAGQPDPGHEPVPGTHGFLDEAGISAGELELTAADQPQRAVVLNVAPGEEEVAVGTVAADVGPAEVKTVGLAPHGDRYLPARRRRITGDWLAGQPGLARHDQPGPIPGLGAQGDVNVVVLPGGARQAGAPGQAGGLDHDGERSEFRGRAPGGTSRRGRRRVLLIGPPQQAEDLGVNVLGPAEGDPHGGSAEVPGGEQAATGTLALQPQAEVHAALGRRLDHGEGTAGRDQADERLAGLHRHRAERGQRREYRVEHRPKLRAV
jgi:thioredoxin reductase